MHRILLSVVLSCSGITTLLAQGDASQQFVSIPGDCRTEQVTFLLHPVAEHFPNGYRVVRSGSLKKSDIRKGFGDLTEKEKRSLQRKARQVRSCTIVVVENYETPTDFKYPDPVEEARKKEEIHFMMVQVVKPL